MRSKRAFTGILDTRLLLHGLVNANGLVNYALYESYWRSSLAHKLNLRQL